MGVGESKLEEENDDGHKGQWHSEDGLFTDMCCTDSRKERGDSARFGALRTHVAGEDKLAQRCWDAET